MFQILQATGEIYQGHFGEFTITEQDRLGVVIYRGGLLVAASCFAVGVIMVIGGAHHPLSPLGLTGLFLQFLLGFRR